VSVPVRLPNTYFDLREQLRLFRGSSEVYLCGPRRTVPASLSTIIQRRSFKDRGEGAEVRRRGRYVPLVKIKLKLAVNIHNTEPRSDFAGTSPPYLFPPLQNRSGSILPRFNYAIARELSTLLDSSRRTIKYSA